MDSPVRKQQKRNDYLRHKMFRKIKRRRKAEREQAINAPAKELRRMLRKRTFKCGKDAYQDGKDNVFIPQFFIGKCGFCRTTLKRPHYASGKDSGIHIKPENRGKFTRLKKRTGKSASWFKAHGTPAQKKMAVFALNSRKWSHKK